MSESVEYAIVVEKYGNGWNAYVPDVPGCVAADKTLEATHRLIREALALHLQDMRATGQEIPQPSTFVAMVHVA
jgi:predicted RNase H-like HicB family nuclease